MYKVLQAICQNGNLIFSEQLSSELEGKKLKVILVEADVIQDNKERFLQLVDEYSFALPDDYQFNRGELYDR
ncbi:hypothetical protein [Okeania sp. KiyG1]|uniref:hypothetical protein n=1 Tax=Okeania sp. KiyG1 TaxID=2720165 RepID=UPI0019219076|nr:hypothetical protein [Okeania sp. KiyG1]GGA28330.1 hypothetical protein CYANOKiyG1_44580 [Okeania sp. KiyG1]